jgi:hypothetical protein
VPREAGANACGRVGRFQGEGSCPRAATGRVEGAGRTQDSPPHPPAARGGTTGAGPDDGCRGRVGILQAQSGGGAGEDGLADTRWGNGGGHRALQMPEDLSEHLAVRDDRENGYAD